MRDLSARLLLCVTRQVHQLYTISRGGMYMYCMYCGKQLPEDAEYCIACGKPVFKDDNEANVEELAGGVNIGSNELSNHHDIAASVSSLSEEEVVDAICPKCGYNGKMLIVEKNNISAVSKAVIYVVGFTSLLIIGYILELIFVNVLPTILLYIIGFLLFGTVYKGIGYFIKGASIKRIKCPHCKQIMQYKVK